MYSTSDVRDVLSKLRSELRQYVNKVLIWSVSDVGEP